MITHRSITPAVVKFFTSLVRSRIALLQLVLLIQYRYFILILFRFKFNFQQLYLPANGFIKKRIVQGLSISINSALPIRNAPGQSLL